jgi:hypothetical protein
MTSDGARVERQSGRSGRWLRGKRSSARDLAGHDATGLIEPGWRGVVHASGAVILERS